MDPVFDLVIAVTTSLTVSLIITNMLARALNILYTALLGRRAITILDSIIIKTWDAAVIMSFVAFAAFVASFVLPALI